VYWHVVNCCNPLDAATFSDVAIVMMYNAQHLLEGWSATFIEMYFKLESMNAGVEMPDSLKKCQDKKTKLCSQTQL
jgi:hypothetical protein